jgi:peptide-methionine (S)-S-oxide reductase
MTSIVLGGGCFWCLEAVYKRVKGVTDVTSGYAGGDQADPTYEQVSSGRTGHAEVVQVTFDEDITPLDEILGIFWTVHDPTTANRQGYDVGTQYRSVILTTSDEQLAAAKTSAKEAQKLWDKPLTTEIKPLENFYEAEAYHQDYYDSNPEQAYCQIVINPKLKKLREKYAQLVKPGQ